MRGLFGEGASEKEVNLRGNGEEFKGIFFHVGGNGWFVLMGSRSTVGGCVGTEIIVYELRFCPPLLLLLSRSGFFRVCWWLSSTGWDECCWERFRYGGRPF